MRDIEARFQLERPGFTLDVDLRLPGRGVSALFGVSGSGKTTLLRCIAGLERAARGRLVVDGEVWQDGSRWRPTHQRPIGYVFQEASLFPHLSVQANLRYGLRRSPGASDTPLTQAIELLGIGHLLARRPAQLSGGERQRVAIARALAVSPRVLLMDEPLSALDLRRRQEVLPYLDRLHDELAMPLLYVSHAPDEVARLADHLVVLEQGRVQAQGPLRETLSRLDLPIRLGEDASAIVDARVTEIDAAWHLVRVDFDGGHLWARDPGLVLGQRVRVRVLARDVSLALAPGTSSIQNVLPGVVDAVGDDEHPGLALVRVRVGDALLLSRLTRRSAAALQVAPGQALWVQVKSVALLE
ncbi:molybdenum ABC transporter ATP-binding protein [Ideonella sp. 4Y16]|uniref:Molybdenum ABC transporter ATP-binding protein n=2 Tax=Ideonella TaxID=36862 RepID=A0A940YXU1_9BURK|nr:MULTISPECIES: molybdenum ABC transporter ATP-binding protein [Ideonella]MBQ0933054.1 molybdenum ABC transporter ATP-binding protein [Ideonella alba]MBQ0945866.1 molybdenum ABC transporter ATP-binding protein [Ideonella alba]MBQ0961150.1 molybdenum ABC transporter ATP-binding protein [Ideonella aquatica]